MRANGVPGAIPPSGSPRIGSYTYEHLRHFQRVTPGLYTFTALGGDRVFARPRL